MKKKDNKKVLSKKEPKKETRKIKSKKTIPKEYSCSCGKSDSRFDYECLNCGDLF